MAVTDFLARLADYRSRLLRARQDEFLSLQEDLVGWLGTLPDDVTGGLGERACQYETFFRTCQQRYLALRERQAADELLRAWDGKQRPEVGPWSSSGGAIYRRLAGLNELASLSNCTRFVMVGCGAFPATLIYAHLHCPKARIVGLDLDPGIFRVAQQVLHASRASRVDLRCHDASDFDYANSDVVYLANQVRGKRAVLSRVAETAGPEARVVVREPVGAGKLLAECVSDDPPPPFVMVRQGRASPQFLSRDVLLTSVGKPEVHRRRERSISEEPENLASSTSQRTRRGR
jgi:hypothetical protein